MISRTVTFTDYDDNKQTETVWFHLSRATVFDNLDLEEDFEKLEAKFKGDKREITREETIEILKLVKRLFKLSYGVRFEVDGKTRFRQNDEVLQQFEDSPAYDAILWDLFSNPEDIFAFLSGIFPKDLRDEAQQKMKQPQDRLPKHAPEKPVEQNVADTTYDETADAPNPNGPEIPYKGTDTESIEELEARLAAAKASQAG